MGEEVEQKWRKPLWAVCSEPWCLHDYADEVGEDADVSCCRIYDVFRTKDEALEKAWEIGKKIGRDRFVYVLRIGDESGMVWVE